MHHILIADDHPTTRLGVKYSILEHFDQVKIFEACNGDELVSIVKEEDIDLVLMDLNMPGTDPQRVLQTILVLKPGIGVIIFSMNKEEIFGLNYLKMGAMGYLRKDCETQEMVTAINCVLRGTVYIKKEMQQYYLGKNAIDEMNPFTTLTKKELEVLRHLSRGESVSNISQVMNISSSTTATHKANIFAKLKITNMYELRSITELYPI